MSLNARVLGLLAVLAVPAAAAELTDFVPTRDGAMACWQRIYDASHLELHPKQEVTAMTFAMSFEKYDASDPGLHYFGLDVALRDGRKGTTSGGCWTYEGSVRCGVDCDGGGLALQLREDGALLADLEAYGYVRIESACGGGEATSFSLEPGEDDRQFLLHPVADKLCKSLLPSW